MSDIVIKTERLGKRYTIGHQAGRPDRTTFREALARSGRDLWNKTRDLAQGKPIIQGDTQEEVWALQDVHFDIRRGEAVGIIGRNGAGKSTLLKVLSRITEPTTGRVIIRGRVASLLEVGTGFHSELSGRENIYLNGTILGMTRAEIKRKFDEIVDFAEVEKYLDTPVKRYSSGMYVRLAFAVAAHLEPEILLVDEVLAVGDVQFQKKCLGKMGSVAKEGRTVLFVSHNMTAIQNLCKRVVWLDRGRIAADGAAGDVVSDSLRLQSGVERNRLWPEIETAPGNDKVRLRAVSVCPLHGSPEDQITVQTPLKVTCEYWNLAPNAYLNLSLLVFTMQGVMAFNTASIHDPVRNGKPFPKGLFRSTCYIPGNLLNNDTYAITLLVVKDAANVIFTMENAVVFDVIDDTKRIWHGKWPGAVRPVLEWETKLQ